MSDKSKKKIIIILFSIITVLGGFSVYLQFFYNPKANTVNKTKDYLIYVYGSSCSLDCSSDDCEWTHTDRGTVKKFDPNNP